MNDDYQLPQSVASLPVIDPAAASPALVAPKREPRPAPPAEKTIEQKLLEGKIIAAISQVYDPEIPVNVYDLGLIYGIDIYPDNSVIVRMTLTAPGCPVAGSLPVEVEKRVESVPEVKEAEVVLVWEPTWTKSMMSEVAQLQLGFL